MLLGEVHTSKQYSHEEDRISSVRFYIVSRPVEVVVVEVTG